MIVKLKNVRLAFPSLFVPTKGSADSTDLKYRAKFLIPKNHPQLQEVKDALIQAAKDKWKDKAPAILNSIKGNPNKFCFQEGDLKEYDGYAGCMVLGANSKRKPRVVDRDSVTILTEADGRPYGGCYVNCSFEPFTYEKGGNGISCDLRGVQFYKDGDAFSGGTPVDENEFDEVSDFGNGDDSAAGLL